MTGSKNTILIKLIRKLSLSEDEEESTVSTVKD